MNPAEALPWKVLRPLYEGLFFDLGPKEVERRTGLGFSTLYGLLNGTTHQPRARTRRDIQMALEAWQPGICGMERTAE